MSKFFAPQDESSESSQENEQQEEKIIVQQQQIKIKKKISESDEDDQDQGVRVILSEKDKKFGKMIEVYQAIQKKLKLEDYVNVQKQFEEMQKLYGKNEKLIEKKGIPDCFIHCLIMIQNLTEGIQTEQKQKLSKTNNTAINTLKQKIKKLQKQFEKEIEQMNKKQEEERLGKQTIIEEKQKEPEDPLDYLDSSQDAQYFLESDSEDMFGKKEEEEDDDDNNSDMNYVNTDDPAIRRLRWLKKAPKDEKDKEEDRKRLLDEKEQNKLQKQRDIKVRQIKNRKDYENIGYKKKDLMYVDKTQVDQELKRINHDRVKNVDNNEDNLFKLESMLNLFPNEKIKRMEIIIIIFAVRFDVSKFKFPLYMQSEYWKANLANLNEALNIIQQLTPSQIASINHYQEEQEFKYTQANLRQLLANQFETLEIEINKAFRNFEQVHQEYVQRLKDLPELLLFGRKIYRYFKECKDEQNQIKIGYILLVSMYYLQEEQIQKVKVNSIGSSDGEEFYKEISIREEMKEYYQVIMGSELEQKRKIRAKLMMIYHLSNHDDLKAAKDMLLMSRLQDIIQYQDSLLQILYNRCIVQIGLSAFRLGHYQESYNILNELCSLQRTKEVLGQGISKQSLNEKEERKRQTLLHQYINTELVDTVFLIDSMITETLHILIDPYDQKKLQNKSIFRKFLEFYEKNQYFTEPETNREIVLAATKELIKGGWSHCIKYLQQFKFWANIQNSTISQATLFNKIKIISIQTYLIYNKNNFDNLHLTFIQQLFQIPITQIKSIVSKLIFNRDILANMDYNNNVILFEHNDISQLQRISQQFTEKLYLQLSHNERIYDSKFGGDYTFNKEEIPESILQAKATKLKQSNKKKQTKVKQTQRKKK